MLRCSRASPLVLGSSMAHGINSEAIASFRQTGMMLAHVLAAALTGSFYIYSRTRTE
jgi:hypothetical protein